MAKKKISPELSIARFFPKKKAMKNAAAPMDAKIHRLMEIEMKRENIGWKEFFDAASKSFLAERGIKFED